MKRADLLPNSLAVQNLDLLRPRRRRSNGPDGTTFDLMDGTSLDAEMSEYVNSMFEVLRAGAFSLADAVSPSSSTSASDPMSSYVLRDAVVTKMDTHELTVEDVSNNQATVRVRSYVFINLLLV